MKYNPDISKLNFEDAKRIQKNLEDISRVLKNLDNSNFKNTAGINWGKIDLTGFNSLNYANYNVIDTTSDVSIATNNNIIILDGSSNSVTATMPSSPKLYERHSFICRDSTNTVDIDWNGKNFDGDSGNFKLFEDESLDVIYDGTEWRSGG